MNNRVFDNRETDFREQSREYESRRKRAIRYYRCREGVKQLIAKPWKMLFILLWVLSLSLMLYKADAYAIDIAESAPLKFIDSIFEDIMTGAAVEHRILQATKAIINISVILIFILILSGLLSWLGTPRRARIIEHDIAAALVLSKIDYHKRPFLISYKRVKGSAVTEYVFWSKWIPLDKWKNQEIESGILTALDCCRVEDYKYGGGKRKSKHIIVMRVTSGAEPAKKEELYDDEI